MKLPPFDAEFFSASYKINKKTSTDSKETISKDYWLEGSKRQYLGPTLPFLPNDLS